MSNILDNLLSLMNNFGGQNNNNAGGFDFANLLKNFPNLNNNNNNNNGFDLQSLLPLISLFANANQNSNSGANNIHQEKKEEKKAVNVLPLSPIVNIADKNITYALTRYISK